MDPDVVEVPPPPRMLKHKEIDLGSVIEIDDDDDSAGMMFFDKMNKGKSIQFVSDGYDDRLVEEAGVNLFGPSGGQGIASANGAESSKSFFAGTPTIINLDDHSSDESCDYIDDYTDLFLDEDMDIDEYAMLQAHFDNSDIPPGVEAPVPFLLDPQKSNEKSVTRSNSSHANGLMISDVAGTDGFNSSSSSKLAEAVHLSSTSTPGKGSSLRIQLDYTSQPTPTQLDSNGPHGINSYSYSRSANPARFGSMSTSGSSSSMPNDMDNASQPTVVDMPLPFSHSQPAQSKRKVANLQHKGGASSSALGVLSKSRWRRPFQGRKKQLNSSSSTSFDSVNQPNGLKPPSSVDPYFIPYKVHHQNIASSYHSVNYPAHIGVSGDPLGVPKYPPGLGPPLPWSQPPVKANTLKAPFVGIAHSNFDPWGAAYFPQDMADVPWFGNLNHRSEFATPSSDSDVQAISTVDKAEVLKKFQIFKQFDTVEDHTDHQYQGEGSSMKHSSKSWAKRIQEEWKILERDLPDNIFVRVYESRMDLLRAVIVGAEGTPYHDGLFFFDVFFPNGYPNVPPHVFYHSGGLRLNPNLYNTGKVCLSLLNTWSGNKNEKWLPGTSTMLQVLVSIQALILNAKPYFNEPGYAHMAGSIDGEKRSLQYNESTFILSLKTMTYSMRRPPKHFEDFMMGHFLTHAYDILVACKAYLEGAQVGCLVKGGVQDVDEGDKSSSKQFKESLASFVRVLIKDFTRIGVEDCEKYLPTVPNANGEGASNSSTSRNALKMLSISG